MTRLRATLIACSLLAGCSGGGGTSLPASQTIANAPANPSAPTAKKRGAAFTITIPKATAASEKRLARIMSSVRTGRRPQYVSAGTQSLVVALTSVNSTPVSPVSNYAINVGGAGCTSSNGVTTCTLVVPAPAGTDAFTIRTYNAAQSSVNPASPAGAILSAQTTTVSVLANTANVVNVPVVLNALVASMNVSAGAGYGWYGSQTVPITIQLRDAAGDLIVGPGAFLDGNGNPITVTLADSDATVTSLPTTSFTATTLANASVTYTGAGLPAGATLTASAPGVTSATTTFAPSLKSGSLFVATGNGTELWQTTASPPVYVTTVGSGYVRGAALDASGTLYQYIFGIGSIARYKLGSTTATSPIAVGDPSYALAAATSGRVYAGVIDGLQPVYFDPTSSTATNIAGTYQFNVGVAVDPASQRLVTEDELTNKIFAYGSNLAQAPSTIYTGTSIDPYQIAFRSDGTLFFVDNNTGNVYSISTPLSSPGAPTLVSQGLSGVKGIALNAAGDIFLSTTSAIYKVPAGASLPATPSVLFSPHTSNDAQLVLAP